MAGVFPCSGWLALGWFLRFLSLGKRNPGSLAGAMGHWLGVGGTGGTGFSAFGGFWFHGFARAAVVAEAAAGAVGGLRCAG